MPILKLNDQTYNVYQGIVDLNIEGKGTEKYHLFIRGNVWDGQGQFSEYHAIDNMELRYVYNEYHGGPLDKRAWYYFLPGFGYKETKFTEYDWSRFNICPSPSSLFLE